MTIVFFPLLLKIDIRKFFSEEDVVEDGEGVNITGPGP